MNEVNKYIQAAFRDCLYLVFILILKALIEL